MLYFTVWLAVEPLYLQEQDLPWQRGVGDEELEGCVVQEAWGGMAPEEDMEGASMTGNMLLRWVQKHDFSFPDYLNVQPSQYNYDLLKSVTIKGQWTYSPVAFVYIVYDICCAEAHKQFWARYLIVGFSRCHHSKSNVACCLKWNIYYNACLNAS